MQRIDHPDPDACNAEVLHELDNGADGLVLIPAGAIGAHGYGIAPTPDAIERALAGVHLDAGIAIALEFSPHDPGVAVALAALVERQGLSPAAVDIRFGLDPLGAFARHGRSSAPWRERPPRIGADRRRPVAPRLQRPVHRRRRARHPRCRRHRSAGARVHARHRCRLSARAGSRRHRARRRAPHDRVPADRRRRPVPDHREIPRHPANSGSASRRAAASRRRRPSSRRRPHGGR